MVIQPQTVFEVLKDVPLTSTYQHTILFDSLTDQDIYFNSKVKKRFTDFTYVIIVDLKMLVMVISGFMDS